MTAKMPLVGKINKKCNAIIVSLECSNLINKFTLKKFFSISNSLS